MSSFSYPNGDEIKIDTNGDITVTSGGTITKYSKSDGKKTETPRNPPKPPTPPPVPEKTDADGGTGGPIKGPGGGIEYTYTDTSKTPNVVTKVRFRPTGDVEIETSDGHGNNTEYKYIEKTGHDEIRKWSGKKKPKDQPPEKEVPPNKYDPEPKYAPPATPAPSPSPVPPPSGGGSDSDKDKKKPKKPKRPSKKTKASGTRKTVSRPMKKAVKKKKPVKRSAKKKMGKRKK